MSNLYDSSIYVKSYNETIYNSLFILGKCILVGPSSVFKRYPYFFRSSLAQLTPNLFHSLMKMTHLFISVRPFTP